MSSQYLQTQDLLYHKLRSFVIFLPDKEETYVDFMYRHENTHYLENIQYGWMELDRTKNREYSDQENITFFDLLCLSEIRAYIEQFLDKDGRIDYSSFYHRLSFVKFLFVQDIEGIYD